MLGHNFFQICNYMISPDMAHWGLPPTVGKILFLTLFLSDLLVIGLFLFCDNLKVLV